MGKKRNAIIDLHCVMRQAEMHSHCAEGTIRDDKEKLGHKEGEILGRRQARGEMKKKTNVEWG